MGQFLQTFAIWLVGMAVPFAAGLPLAHLVLFRKADALATSSRRDALWAVSLPLGYAIITAVLKLAVALDIPVAYSAWPLLVLLCGMFAAWLWMLRKGGGPLSRLRGTAAATVLPSKAFLLLLAAVSLLFSIPYFSIGAIHYRGYGWWDLYTFGAQAELFRSTPFSLFGSVADTQPYAEILSAIFGGVHRMSRAVYQAFAATVCGSDGASTLGMLSLFTLVTVFCAMVYATKDLELKPSHRYAACFFGSCLPGLVVNQLEGFLPVGLFCGMAILCCKLFCEVFAAPAVAKSLLCGLLLSSFATTLQDGIPLLLGLLALSAAFSFLFSQPGLKKLLCLLAHLGIVLGSAIALNLPYLSAIWRELSSAMARGELNYIYPWALSSDSLTWTFYGSLLDGFPDLLATAARFLAIALYAAGLYGILSGFIHKRRPESLNFTALLAVPYVFAAMPQDYPYAFFKVFTFGMPLIVLGGWQFWANLRQMLDEKLFGDSPHRAVLRAKKILFPAISLVLALFFFATTALSFRKTMLVLKDMPSDAVTDDQRVYQIIKGGASHPETWPHYDAMAARSGQDILLVSGNSDLFYYWMAYHGRNNHIIYPLVPEQEAAYDKSGSRSRQDWHNIPPDVEIVYAPPGSFGITLVDEAYRSEAAALLAGQNAEGGYTIVRWPDPNFMYGSFRLTVFTKAERYALFHLKVDAYEGAPVSLSLEGQDYALPSGGEAVIPLHLPVGGSEYYLDGPNDVKLLVTDMRLEFADEAAWRAARPAGV